MARKDELFKSMCEYCEENGGWRWWMSIKEWNRCVEAEYGAATFTALVNEGRLERRKGYKTTAYDYHIVTTEEIKNKIEEEKQRSEIKYAEWVISHYEEQIALRKARYEEMIKQAEEQYQRDLEWEAEKLAAAKATLGIEE